MPFLGQEMGDMPSLKKTFFFSKYIERFSQYIVAERAFDAENGIVTFMLLYAVVFQLLNKTGK